MAKKKHHYLSRYYLDGFCDSRGMLWGYSKDDLLNPFEGKPETLGFEKKLYRLDGVEGLGFIHFC